MNGEFCSVCLSYEHDRECCQLKLQPTEFFVEEIEKRANIIINSSPDFACSEDEYGPYQNPDPSIEKVPVNYNLKLGFNFSPKMTEEIEEELTYIYKNKLEPSEDEKLIRYWSIYKTSKLIENLLPGIVCAPQGSSLSGTFLVYSDVDLLVHSDKIDIETIYEVLIKFEKEHVNSFLSNIKLFKRKKVSYIECIDKETGINYEIMKSQIGGLLTAKRNLKLFEKFDYLKKLYILINIFFKGLECNKVFNGGFSSTMILQLCTFFAFRQMLKQPISISKKEEEKSDNLLANNFINILSFLSNMENFKNVVVCSFGGGSFFKRTPEFDGKELFVMYDAVERTNLMGNITEKTKFLSDHCKIFLENLYKMCCCQNGKKVCLNTLFPNFSNSYHLKQNDIDQILDISKEIPNFSFSDRKILSVKYNKKFFENNINQNDSTESETRHKKVYMCMKSDDKDSIDFCYKFFRPEAMIEHNNMFLMKYDSRYMISVDLMKDLRNNNNANSVKIVDADEFEKEFPLFDHNNCMCEHESFIKYDIE